MYYGGSSEHPVLGLLARSPGHGPDEPLAAPQVAADVDAGGYTRRRRRAMVCPGSGSGYLWRSPAISRPAGVNSGSGLRRRAVPGIEAAFSPETPLCTGTPLLGGIAAARSIFISLGPHDHSLRGGSLAGRILSRADP